MPKKVKQEELEAMVQAVALHPDGVGIETLLESTELRISRRTWQRRLSQLVEAGRLVTEGEGRAIRYRLAANRGRLQVTLPVPAVEFYGEAYVPLSPEGGEIKSYVRQPRQKRKPIGYNPEFLERYRPNETFYLPETLRRQLHRLGMAPDGERPAGTFARDILGRLLIDLSWASSRLEGNTYSRLDTQRLIELGQAAEGKDALEAQMILNHKAAIEMLVDQADLIGFNPYTILNLHAQLSDGLLTDPRECGRLRERAVDISGSVYLPLAMPQRIEDQFNRLLSLVQAITDPFEQAFFAMIHIPYLQPFIDVNKRVSRLAANISLIKANLCPLSFIDVPERAYVDAVLGIYELNRVELLHDVFIWAYERSCQQYVAVQQSLAPPDSFRLRYRTALTETIRCIIQNRRPATAESIRAAMASFVKPGDRERFVELALMEFEALYEGNIARFGVRPSEFAAWQAETGTKEK
jgi:Fic family protein